MHGVTIFLADTFGVTITVKDFSTLSQGVTDQSFVIVALVGDDVAGIFTLLVTGKYKLKNSKEYTITRIKLIQIRRLLSLASQSCAAYLCSHLARFACSRLHFALTKFFWKKSVSQSTRL